jgi:hypothetical protein
MNLLNVVRRGIIVTAIVILSVSILYVSYLVTDVLTKEFMRWMNLIPNIYG